MARFDTAFDATGIEPTTGYDVLPAGKYRAQIVESEMRVTRNGMGQFLWLMLDIIFAPWRKSKYSRFSSYCPPSLEEIICQIWST